MPLKRDWVPREAREWLGVPSLDADNVFTGDNTFADVLATRLSSPLIGTDSDLTLYTTDVFSFSAASKTNGVEFLGNARSFAFPDASGTLALLGGALSLPYRAVSALYTVALTDGVVACNGTFTVTLPAAASCAGQLFIVKNAGAGVVTLDGDGAETIDGAATLVLAAAAVGRVLSTGAAWIVL